MLRIGFETYLTINDIKIDNILLKNVNIFPLEPSYFKDGQEALSVIKQSEQISETVKNLRSSKSPNDIYPEIMIALALGLVANNKAAALKLLEKQMEFTKTEEDRIHSLEEVVGADTERKRYLLRLLYAKLLDEDGTVDKYMDLTSKWRNV